MYRYSTFQGAIVIIDMVSPK